MSQLVMIYSPDGEPFEVPAYKVGDLVLNQGWSQQQPTIVEIEPEPAPAPPRGRAKPVEIVTPEPDESEDGDDMEDTDGESED